jgi:hypothetical protein
MLVNFSLYLKSILWTVLCRRVAITLHHGFSFPRPFLVLAFFCIFLSQYLKLSKCSISNIKPKPSQGKIANYLTLCEGVPRLHKKFMITQSLTLRSLWRWKMVRRKYRDQLVLRRKCWRSVEETTMFSVDQGHFCGTGGFCTLWRQRC